MQKTLKCNLCNCYNNIKDLEVKTFRMTVGDSEYISNYYICPHCNELNLFSLDSKITEKFVKELNKNNGKIEQWLKNGCTVTPKMKKDNIKLRMKVNLLRRMLYNKLDGKTYQLFDVDNNIIKTGIFKKPINNFGEENKNEK